MDRPLRPTIQRIHPPAKGSVNLRKTSLSIRDVVVTLAVASFLIALVAGMWMLVGTRGHNVEVIDGCEYLVDYIPNFTRTHKGDCSNPIHGGR